MSISSKDKVTILDKDGNWYNIKFEKDGKTYEGYIRADLLEIKDEDNQEEIEANDEEKNVTENNQVVDNKEVETSNNINSTYVKEGYESKSKGSLLLKLIPAINAEIVEEIKPGVEFKVLEVLNKWCHIETDNQSGWILISKLNENVYVTNSENVQNQEENSEAIEEEAKEEAKEEQKEESSKKEGIGQEESETSKKEETKKETSNTTKYVSVDTLNVREKPSSSSQVIEQLDINQKITVLEVVDDSWAKIEINGKTGYVSNKFLSDKKTAVTSRSGEAERENEDSENNKEIKDSEVKEEKNSSSTGAQVVEYAKSFIGKVKYVSGGNSPSTGFDCSGFTCYVYKHFGITLNRVSGAQASNGVAVDRDNLQLGDLVLFNDNNNSKIGHVGIYIGGNQFVHAANGKKGVITTSLSDSYYAKRYVCARRVI